MGEWYGSGEGITPPACHNPRMAPLPDTMHAVLLLGHGGPGQLAYRRDVPVPRAGPGDVLVAVRAAGVNNTDINTRVGWYAPHVTGATSETAAADTAPDSGSWSGVATTTGGPDVVMSLE